MKQFLSFLPLMIFFITNKLYDIYYASGALIIATTLTLIYTWLFYRKIKQGSLITFILVIIFSFLTIYYHDAQFIKWKVTVMYTLFAIMLLVSQFILGKPLIKYTLGKKIHLPNRIWNNLNVAWVIFFLLCGTINIYVALCLPQNIWVIFKVFGLTVLLIIFTLLSTIYMYRNTVKNK